MTVNQRIASLRTLMEQKGMGAYIIPSSDPHQSEYTPEHWKTRRFISGFTGSAGTALVTGSISGLWTDGRYFIQGEKELAGSEMKLFKMQQEGVPTVEAYLAESLPSGSVVGFDGRVVSCTSARTLEKAFRDAGKEVCLSFGEDLVQTVWTNRPSLPTDPAFILEEQYSGRSTKEKLEQVQKKMKEKGASHYLVSTLDDAAWLLNVRGNDVACTPVVISYVLVDEKKATWFVHEEKVTDQVRAYVSKNGVEIRSYEEVGEALKAIPKGERIYYDPAKTSVWAASFLQEGVKKSEGQDVVWQLKAIKNPVEIENLRRTHIKDSVALVKFAHWLYQQVPLGTVTEISAAQQLESFRREVPLYKGPSFDTIAAYKEHGAMMHYKASEENQHTLEAQGLFLLDSGGQYLDGTTDITRTFALGELTQEERRDFTLTLQSHIALAKVLFLYGSTGTHLDPIARQCMWKEGLDYKCGTGHGVGFFLSVHEGPQRIAPILNDTALEAGMVVSNEPGVYREGKHGIRLENILLVEKRQKTDCGQFMGFEMLSWFPIDKRAIDVSLLTSEELTWLNQYHEEVYQKLSPYLEGDARKWLEEATATLA